jgi:hypothetical protein
LGLFCGVSTFNCTYYDNFDIFKSAWIPLDSEVRPAWWLRVLISAIRMQMALEEVMSAMRDDLAHENWRRGKWASKCLEVVVLDESMKYPRIKGWSLRPGGHLRN